MKVPPAVAVDTAPWIYWFEGHEGFRPGLEEALADVLSGRALAVTSVLALLEAITGALQRGNEDAAREYVEFFTRGRSVVLMEVDASIACRAAELRARYRLRTPDAIHLATALVAGAGTFVTADRRLARVKEIEVRIVRPSKKRRSPAR